jgi:hypothetical protein
MRTRLCVVASLAVGVLLAPAAADAKGFRPGDLRVCNAKACVAILRPDRAQRAFAPLLRPTVTARDATPALGEAVRPDPFQHWLRDRDRRDDHLDRFLSYGVNMGQFAVGQWYRVPATAAVGLRALTYGLQPLHLNRSIIWSASR